MTIHLPEDLESSLKAELNRGHFASLDEAMAEAVRLLLRARTGRITPDPGPDDPVIGSLRDAADELDEIVADAIRGRTKETWRDFPVE